MGKKELFTGGLPTNNLRDRAEISQPTERCEAGMIII
jgi:hypothetical protein